MATTGEGNKQGGAAGGKIRKRPFRRPQTTPYGDGPAPTGLRRHRKGWLSKLVEPAAKLISVSAHLFFSSVFGKRVPPPPPPPPPPPSQPSTVVPNNNTTGTQEPNINPSSSGISAVEHMLKQKTFTRSEIDGLTVARGSRTPDSPVGDGDDEKKKIQTNLIPKPVSASVRQTEFSSSPRKENGIERHGVHGGVVLGPEYGVITTPRTRGRSAIYCMGRTPNPCPRVGSKQVGLKRGISCVLEHDIGSGSVGSIRRIRSRKSNLLLVSSSPLSGSQTLGFGSDAAQHHPTSLTHKKLHLLDEHKGNVSNTLIRENEENKVGRTLLVPSKSTEMATKILQHIDPKSTKSSPVSKLVAARDRTKLPTRLTPTMLSGKALKSLEDIDIVDSSNCLHKLIQDNTHNYLEEEVEEEDTVPRNATATLPDSTCQKQEKVEEEDVPKVLVFPCDSSAPHAVVTGALDIATVSVKNSSMPSFKSADFSPQPPPNQKKRAFRMSAHEDSLELDDDADVSTPLAEGRDKLETCVVENKGIASEAALVDRINNPTLSKFKPCAAGDSELNKGSDLGNNDKNLGAGKSTSFTFPTPPSPSMSMALQLGHVWFFQEHLVGNL